MVDLLAETVRVREVALRVDSFQCQLAVEPIELTREGGREHVIVRVKAMMARLPEKRFLKLHATWKDGAREALYTWLYFHRLGRLAAWAGKRWPVKWTEHDAALLFPSTLLSEDLKEGMAQKLFFLDQHLAVFTGRRSAESRT